MNLKEFTYGILMLIIPLILIILIYRLYVAQICHHNKECMKKKLLVNMDEISKKLKFNVDFLKNKVEIEEPEEPKEQVIEGFFGGLTDWFLGSSPSNSDASANLNIDGNVSSSLNPSTGSGSPLEMTDPDLKGSYPSDEMKDAPNGDLLNSLKTGASKLKEFKTKKINSLQDLKNVNSEIKSEIDNKNQFNIKDQSNLIQPPKHVQKDLKEKVQQNFSPEIISDPKLQKNEVTVFTDKPNKEDSQKQAYQPQNIQSLFGNCNFFSDKCPSTHMDLGSIGLNGIESNAMLSCGNVENTKHAKAMAKIRNNGIEEVVIVDKGHGFNPSKPPGVKVIGGRGNDAQLEAVVDDNGYVSFIKIIHPGYNYTETPNIIIDPPLMNSTCHFCCKK